MAQLRPAQEEDVQALLRSGLRAIIANAPGTGKTATTISAISRTRLTRTPALIVAPASVTINWSREFAMWAPDLRVRVLDGPDEAPTDLRHDDVIILSWALLSPRIEQLVRLPWKCVVADEAHFAKNPDADRSLALRDLCVPDRGLLLLTGTPIVNTLHEMEQLEGLFSEGKPLLLRRLLSEVAPDIPPKKRSYLYIELDAKTRRDYKSAEDDFEGWLRSAQKGLIEEGYSESEIERKLAAEALVKLGYLRRLLGAGKVRAAADFAARTVRIGEPLVIFCEHQATVQGLSKCLRRQRLRHGILDGNTTSKQRQTLIDLFQRNRIPLLICTKAGSVGITLHAARHMLFVERFYTAAEEDQSEDRIRRIGQRFKTTIWFLHVPETVDDRVDVIVRAKRQLIAQTIGDEVIGESDARTVTEMIRAWSERSNVERPEYSDLGVAPPMPALPAPPETHAVVFSAQRWTKEGASRWCRMNGYYADRIIETGSILKLRVHPANVFRDQKFSLVRVAKDIQVIVGSRLAKPQEQVVRAQMRHARRG